MRLLFALLFLGTSAHAAERKLSGVEIAKLLPTVIATGTDTRQTFSKAGATTYTFKGRDSYGTWRVQGEQYCSQWPPTAGWDCYTVLADEDAESIVWVGHSGDRTVNQITLKK